MKKKLRSLKICLMASSLIGCASQPLPDFPTPTIKQPLFKKDVTREYTFQKGEFKHKQDHPLDYSNAMFCISAEEYQKIRNWVIKVNNEYTCKENTNVNNPNN